MVTTGPGGTNAITGVVGAWLDSTPMLVLSGQVKRADRMFRPDGTPLGVRQRGSQEVDIVSIIKPITKYAVTIDDRKASATISKKRYTWLSLEDRARFGSTFPLTFRLHRLIQIPCAALILASRQAANTTT